MNKSKFLFFSVLILLTFFVLFSGTKAEIKKNRSSLKKLNSSLFTKSNQVHSKNIYKRKKKSIKTRDNNFSVKSLFHMFDQFELNKDKIEHFITSKLIHPKGAPHTLEDSLNRKEGALKVLALRKYLSALGNTHPRKVLSELESLMKNSKDQTIGSILKEVIASKRLGRNYFSDFKLAVENLRPID